MKEKEKVLITSALPYINNVPHMGHIVGCHLPADIFYRFCVSKGRDVLFIGGSDEHGTPSVVTARQLGVSTQELVDKLHVVHKQIYKKLGISYSIYSRTSNKMHHETVVEIFKEIYKNGYVEKDSVDMYYCEKDQMFLPDRFVVGICPRCGYESANADQCEKCSFVINTGELIEPKCKICNGIPVIKKSEHLYFKLGELSDKLDEWIESKKDIFRAHVYAEAKKWIKDGLKSRAITRDIDWGVKVPFGELENKVFYVWFDAPIGYVSFTREINEQYLNNYWKDGKCKIYHFLGKDNIPFHTIFWPAMLLAEGTYSLPYNVVGYQYLNYEGQKFSKSNGIGVFCDNILDSDIDIDTLRAYLTTVLPENKDSDFKWEGYMNNTNSELVGKLGNFFNRTLNMIWNYFQGELNYDDISDLDEIDSQFARNIKDIPKEISEMYDKAEFREAYKRIMEYASIGNVYLEKKAPWQLMKEEKAGETRKVLYLALNLCKSLSIVAAPIIPESMEKVWKTQMNFDGSPNDSGIWGESMEINVNKQHKISKPSPLFSRIDNDRLNNLMKHFSKVKDLSEYVKNS